MPVRERVVRPPVGQIGLEGLDIAGHLGGELEEVTVDLDGTVAAGLAQARQLAPQVAPAGTLVELRPEHGHHAGPTHRPTDY